MELRLEDRLQITDLINGWMHRDLGQWAELRGLFHSDGIIEITWFEGPFNEFVDRSMKMGASDFKTKHLIGTPVVAFHGEKAIVETNAVIIGDNVRLNLGCEVHNRFYDTVEKREGVWKIVKRQSVYDTGSFIFPCGPVEIDADVVAGYPREYAALAYLLEKCGFPVDRVFATRGSELERKMKSDARAWLVA